MRFQLYFPFTCFCFRIKFLQMNQDPWLEFLSIAFIFRVIVSNKAIGRIYGIPNVNLVVFGGVNYISIMLFHDKGNKKNRHLPGFLVAERSEISNFKWVKAIQEICEMADSMKDISCNTFSTHFQHIFRLQNH